MIVHGGDHQETKRSSVYSFGGSSSSWNPLAVVAAYTRVCLHQQITPYARRRLGYAGNGQRGVHCIPVKGASNNEFHGSAARGRSDREWNFCYRV